jgi:hypothetical protein
MTRVTAAGCRSQAFWYGEEEGRPSSLFGVNPDAAAVSFQDTLHNGQADASAFYRLQVLDPIK